MEPVDPRSRVGRTSARKGRRGILRSLFVVAAGAALSWYLLSALQSQAALTAPAPAPAAPAVTPAPPQAPPLRSYVVKEGDTFAGIMAQFGVVERTAAVLYRGMRGKGLSALFPGDSLVLDMSDSGEIRQLSLRSRLQYWYQVGRGDSDSVLVERRAVSTATAVCIVKGTLITSLSEDLWTLGEGDGLVGLFTEIFAWDVNFFTDPRVGDEFEILFEKRYAEGRSLGYGDIVAARYYARDRTFSAFGLRDTLGRMRYFDGEGRSVQKQFLKAPLRYNRISSGFSFARKHPILGIYRPHLGVDYAAPLGTPVHAAADGVVASAGWDRSYGNQVTLRHGASYVTCYGHLSSISSGVRAGSRVGQGQQIGTVGSTGLSSGPHLDYRMKVDGRNVNPLTVILPSGTAVDERDRARFERVRNENGLMLGGRFRGRSGSWVVEVIPAAQPQSAGAVVKANGDSSGNGGAAGS
jgi:murein DD-endopeptidase MepM/ murein hydrolase activator NlpD